MRNRNWPIDVPINQLMTWRDLVNGDVGIEIEVEGTNLPAPGTQIALWTIKEDHSLRAPRGGACWEYVTHGAIPEADVPNALTNLQGALANSTPRWSYRTSVHVHINVRHMTLRQIYNFMALYYTLEDPLHEWAGGLERCGNLFCQRAVDSEDLIDRLTNALADDRFTAAIQGQGLHYSGLNYSALLKFGSLEFRAMRGNMNVQRIQAWINTLLNLRRLAMVYEHPRAIVEDMSGRGVTGFIHHLVDPYIQPELSRLEHLDERVFNGMRLAQELAYCVPWPSKSEAKMPKVRIRPDAPVAREAHEWIFQQPFEEL